MVCKYAGSTAGVHFTEMRAGEPEKAVVVGDPQTLIPLANDPLGYPLISLEDALPVVIDWYKENYPWQND